MSSSYKDSGLEESCCIDIGPSQVQSPDANLLHELSTLSRMAVAYIYSLNLNDQCAILVNILKRDTLLAVLAQ